MAEIAIPPEFEVGQGYGKVSWSVRAIWENYAGWFHHRSTTELYAVPPDSVSADVVELAGGAQKLLARAGEKFEAGEFEQALHLLDIIGDANADTADSIALGVRVHEALLAQTDNFWLSSWLRNQVKSLAAKKESV